MVFGIPDIVDVIDESDGRGFIDWARALKTRRLDERNYLLDPTLNSELEIKRSLFRCDVMEYINTGSNMEVYGFNADKLAEFLKGRVAEGWYKRAEELASEIAVKYVLKVGLTDTFEPKLGKRTLKLPRHNVHRGFAPLGFPVMHERSRILKNLQDVVRMNVYLGNEEVSPITAPCISTELQKFFKNPDSYRLPNASEYMYTEDDTSNGRMTVHEILNSDGLMKEVLARHGRQRLNDHDAYIALNREKRKFRPYTSLITFFNRPITVGLLAIMRRLLFGYKHPEVNYKQAEPQLRRICEQYKDHSFLMPEQVSYGYDPRENDPEELEQNYRDNEEAVAYFECIFKNLIPDSLRRVFDNPAVLREFCHLAMSHFYALPDYKLNSADALFSEVMVKFIFKAIYLATSFPKQENRKDFENHADLRDFFDLLDGDDRSNLISALIEAVSIYAGSPASPKYHRFQKTCVKVQKHLQCLPEGAIGFESEPIPISELVTHKQDRFDDCPELNDLLALYFYLIDKMVEEPHAFMDHRPGEHLVTNVFLRGEWATLTENVFVSTLLDEEGNRVPYIVNNDPDDAFYSKKRSGELPPHMSLANIGFGMDSVLDDVFLKASGRFLDEVARKEGVHGIRDQWGQIDRLRDWTGYRALYVLNRVKTIARAAKARIRKVAPNFLS